MSVKLIFCTSNACFQKEIDYAEWIITLPVQYDEMKNSIKHTDGYVLYDKNVISDFWNTFSASDFVPYIFERLEINYCNVWRCEGFGYE